MAMVRRPARRGKAGAVPRLSSNPKSESTFPRSWLAAAPPTALPADAEGRIQLPEGGAWVDILTYEKRVLGVPRALDPRAREWILAEELERRYPEVAALIAHARQTKKLESGSVRWRELVVMGTEDIEALRAHIMEAPVVMTARDAFRAALYGHSPPEGSLSDDGTHARVAIDKDESWRELDDDLYLYARGLVAIVTPDDPPHHAEVAAVLRAAFFFNMLRRLQWLAPEAAEIIHPPVVLEAVERFESETRRFVATLAEHGGPSLNFMETGQEMRGLWDLWSRPLLADRLLETVERHRVSQREPEALAPILVDAVPFLCSIRLSDEERRMAARKLAAWLTLRDPDVSTEQIARALAKYVGLDPKAIFAATLRKAQRTRQVLRESVDENPSKKR